MKLTNKQYEELVKALECAYPSEEKLRQMLKLGLDKSLSIITTQGSLRNKVFDVVGAADTEGWIKETS